jgi:hypothetical protein
MELHQKLYVSIMILHWESMKPPQYIPTLNYFAVTETSSSAIVVLPVESIKQLICLLPHTKESKTIFISVPFTYQ